MIQLDAAKSKTPTSEQIHMTDAGEQSLNSTRGDVNLETALCYSRCGWHVFPVHTPIFQDGKLAGCSCGKPDCKNIGKHPRTAKGKDDATTDEQIIVRWWSQCPDANIGLNCGASGLVAIDFDIHKEGYAGGELLDKLHAEHPTTTAKSGSGGFHLLYQQPKDNPLGDKRGALPKGIDVRGAGYIVVVPSVHYSGNLYKWLAYPAQTPPQPLPGFLLNMITKADAPEETVTPNATRPVALDDEKLLERARTASNGADFQRLWDGVTTGYNNDHSSADMALCCYLAFWTGRDAARMDRLFRASGLMREKWDVVHHSDGDTYGGKTISRAIAQTSEVYTPKVYHNDGDEPPIGEDVAVLLGDVAALNGYGPGHSDGEALPDGEETTPPASLDELLEKLGEVKDDRKAVHLFALENAHHLALLDKVSESVFFTHLRERNITTEWIRKELTPAINEARKGKTGQEDGGGFPSGPTSTDYVLTAQKLGYSFRLNDLNDTLEVNGERITDVHEAKILSQLYDRELKNVEVARRAFLAASAEKRYHPVKEYLQGLKWDRQDHIGELAGYFTDKHDPIVYADGKQWTVFHAFFHRWLIGAIAKIYDPTNAQTPMIILAGGQGKGKSYFAKWICPLPDLHFEGAIRPDDKDYLLYLTTRWIWEVSELGATIRKADREALKDFITKHYATFRPAYGRHELVKPALASFIGTVNIDGALLADPTGHRRFWPIELVKGEESIDWGYSTSVDVHQIWAQAFVLFRDREPWQLSTEERAAHAEIVELYEVEDILAGYVQEYFRIEPENPALYTHTTRIISTLRNPSGADVKGSERGLSMQLSSTLTRLGLVRAKRDNRWGYLGIAKKIV